MIHIQLEEVKRVLPIVAEEIRAGRDIVIEDQGQTVAYVKQSQAEHKLFYSLTSPRPMTEARRQELIRLRETRIPLDEPVTLDEILGWIDDGRA